MKRDGRLCNFYFCRNAVDGRPHELPLDAFFPSDEVTPASPAAILELHKILILQNK